MAQGQFLQKSFLTAALDGRSDLMWLLAVI
jgi:hypothetical protein